MSGLGQQGKDTRRWFQLILSVLIALSGSDPCWGQGNMHLYRVSKKIALYKDPDGQLLERYLLPGEKIYLDPVIGTGERRVYHSLDESLLLGYVRDEDLVQVTEDFPTANEESESTTVGSHLARLSIFFTMVEHYQNQYDFGNGTSLTLGPLGGSSTYLSLHYDLPSNRNHYRLGLMLRKLESAGTATYTGTSSEPTSVEVHQQFIGVAFLKKNYFSIRRAYWWGYGAELSMATQVDVNISGSVTQGEIKPLYLFLNLAVGTIYSLGHRWNLSPEASLGVAVNKSAPVIAVELKCGLGRDL